MNEKSWEECEDAVSLLRWANNQPCNGMDRQWAYARKFRLFACACIRGSPLITQRVNREAVGLAEQFADGLIGSELLRDYQLGNYPQGPVYVALWEHRFIDHFTHRLDCKERGWCELPAGKALAAIFRDIMGNPFRPAVCKDSWVDEWTWNIASCAYELAENGPLDNKRLLVLSDALEENGCDDHHFLAHLRSPAPHHKGCWALDLVLGKG